MKVKLDFMLNKTKFGVIDQAIFQLVLNSCTSIKDIRKYLFIFDKDVLAKAICNLVNNQIILVNISQKTLTLSSPVSALYELTKEHIFDLRQTKKTIELIEAYDGVLNIKKNYLNKYLSEYILGFLLSDIDLAYYAGLLNFTIIKVKHGEKK
jgi:sulfur transfer complex TusBCD TusB component (DsrH family)